MAIDPEAFDAFDAKTATPDTSVPEAGVFLGADSQSAGSPAVWTRAAVAAGINAANGVVSVFNYGVAGDGTTDDTESLQAALNANAPLLLPSRRVYSVSAPLVLPRGGASLIGESELGFWSAVIRPTADFSGDALFIADGDAEEGSWAFRNRLAGFMVWCDRVDATALPAVIRLNKAYTIFLERLWLQDVPGAGIHLTGNNYINISRLQIGGRDNATSTYGIRCENDDSDGGGVFIDRSDIENFSVGVAQQENSRVTLQSSYLEGNGTGWLAAGDSDGQMTVLGGRIAGINSGTHCARIEGPNVTVVGGAYTPNGGGGITTNGAPERHSNVHVYGVPREVFAPYRNLYQTPDAGDTDQGWTEFAAVNTKTLTSGAETPIFTVLCPYKDPDTNGGFVEVDVFARLTNNPVVCVKATYTIVFASLTDTMAVDESQKVGFEATGNWSISLAGSASNSDGTITFSVTGTAGGAIGSSASVDMVAKARLMARNGDGTMYLSAV